MPLLDFEILERADPFKETDALKLVARMSKSIEAPEPSGFGPILLGILVGLVSAAVAYAAIRLKLL